MLWRRNWHQTLDVNYLEQQSPQQLEKLEMRTERGEPWPSLPPRSLHQKIPRKNPHPVTATDCGPQWSERPERGRNHQPNTGRNIWALGPQNQARWDNRNPKDSRGMSHKPNQLPGDGIKDKVVAMEANSTSISPQEGGGKVCQIPPIFLTQQPLPRGSRGGTAAPPDFQWSWRPRSRTAPWRGDQGHMGQNFVQFHVHGHGGQEVQGHGGQFSQGQGGQFSQGQGGQFSQGHGGQHLSGQGGQLHQQGHGGQRGGPEMAPQKLRCKPYINQLQQPQEDAPTGAVEDKGATPPHISCSMPMAGASQNKGDTQKGAPMVCQMTTPMTKWRNREPVRRACTPPQHPLQNVQSPGAPGVQCPTPTTQPPENKLIGEINSMEEKWGDTPLHQRL
eukprot:EG_transcript_15569